MDRDVESRGVDCAPNQAQAQAEPVSSPCVDICRLDGDGCCVGCGRLVEEIAEWSQATEARRSVIVKMAAVRRAE